jgi:hypothetical protein
MRALEHRNDLGHQIGAGDARGNDRQRPGGRLTEGVDASGGLSQEGLGAEHVIGQELTGGGQVTAPASPLNQPHADLPLHIGDVLGDGGLADAELRRRRREGTAPSERGERSEPRLDIVVGTKTRVAKGT